MKKLVIALTLSLASASAVSAAPSTFAEAVTRARHAGTDSVNTVQMHNTSTERRHPGFQPWAARNADLLDASRVDVVQIAARDPAATRSFFESHEFMPGRYQ